MAGVFSVAECSRSDDEDYITRVLPVRPAAAAAAAAAVRVFTCHHQSESSALFRVDHRLSRIHLLTAAPTASVLCLTTQEVMKRHTAAAGEAIVAHLAYWPQRKVPPAPPSAREAGSSSVPAASSPLENFVRPASLRFFPTKAFWSVSKPAGGFDASALNRNARFSLSFLLREAWKTPPTSSVDTASSQQRSHRAWIFQCLGISNRPGARVAGARKELEWWVVVGGGAGGGWWWTVGGKPRAGKGEGTQFVPFRVIVAEMSTGRSRSVLLFVAYAGGRRNETTGTQSSFPSIMPLAP